jgi:hypothetical protein
MQQALTLVPMTSGDYDVAVKLVAWKKELEELIAKNNQQAAAAAAQAAKPER